MARFDCTKVNGHDQHLESLDWVSVVRSGHLS